MSDSTGAARRTGVTLGVLLCLGLTACGDPAAQNPLPGTSEAHDTPPESMYACFGTAFPVSAWADEAPAAELEHPGREALERELGGQGLEDWFVLSAEEDHLAVARRRAEARESGDDMLRTHDVVSVRDFGGDAGWHPEQSTSCAPRLVVDDLATVEVWLAGEPQADATRVALLVNEQACNSGESAEGRIRLVRLAEFDDRVEFVLAVQPRGGGQECPSNPDTPYTLELSRPLGERTLIDASVYPPRPVDLRRRTDS